MEARDLSSAAVPASTSSQARIEDDAVIFAMEGTGEQVVALEAAVVKLQAWRNRLDRSVHSSGLILRDWNVSTDEISCLGATESILGVQGHRLRGGIEEWIELLHPDDRDYFRGELEAVRGPGRILNCEYRLRRRSGTYVRVRERGELLLEGDPPSMHLTTIVTDISAQRDLEDRLRHSQRMEAFGQLAGGVAHDFNNLLSVILGYAQIVIDECGADDPRREYLSEIEKAAFRAGSLTNQLLAFNRKEVIKQGILNLNDILGDVGRMLRRLIGEQIELVVEATADLGVIRADRGQLEQVLINLAVSARDAMPRGGTLTICTANATVVEPLPGSIEIPPGDYILLSLTHLDNEAADAGASNDFRANPGEPSTGRGTGLGQAACHGIITQNGGFVLEGVDGENARMAIYFPRVPHPSARGTDRPRPRPAGLPPKTILLVEDDSAVRRLACAILSRLDYRVLLAGDGEEALTVLADNPNVPIDLLLTDIVMPRMGGLDLARRIQPMRPETRILFMSGYPDKSLSTAGLTSKFAFTQKPLVAKDLAAKVRALLDV